MVDDHGEMLALRADMTVPIARVVATRYATAEPPLRFCYAAHAYRAVRPHRGQMREFLQAGIELVGAPGPEGTAEALTVLCRALEATGLRDFQRRAGRRDALPEAAGRLRGAGRGARGSSCTSSARATSSASTASVAALGLAADAAATLARVPRMRGGADVLEAHAGPLRDALDGPARDRRRARRRTSPRA